MAAESGADSASEAPGPLANPVIKPSKKTAKQTRRKYSIRVTGTEVELGATHKKLWFPPNLDQYVAFLHQLVEPLTNSLSKYYTNVEISVLSDPPNMTSLNDWGSFKLAARGISGNPRLADVGGVPYMNDPKYHHITYQLNDIVKCCGMDQALVIGAGAASPTVVGKNAELMPNTLVPGPRHTQFAKMDTPSKPLNNNNQSDEKSIDSNSDVTTENKENKEEKKDNCEEVPVVGIYPAEETGCLANLFLCDGLPGPVLYMKIGQRKVDKTLNLSVCIREALIDFRSANKIDQQIGMGGLFRVTKGKVKAHIMPDFYDGVLENSEQVNNWLKFFEMGPELAMFTTIITGDPTEDNSMHLRTEHTHFYSYRKKHCNEGGHYHYDIVKDVEYEGYFNLAEYIYRIEDAQYNIDNNKMLIVD